MHGVDAIYRLNAQRFSEALTAAKEKARVAEEQGHPKAQAFEDEARAMSTAH